MIALMLWFILSSIFYPLGKMLNKMWDDTVKEIERDDPKEDSEEEEM
jgi:hypothetical protein